MHWDTDINKTYEAKVAGTKIKTQTVFMDLLVKANYTNHFTEFSEYFDFVLKQPKTNVIKLFNHRHIDIPYGTGSCLSGLFIFKNYEYLLKIIKHYKYSKDILDILVSDGSEKVIYGKRPFAIPDESLLNFGQLLYLFKIEPNLDDRYKTIKLYSLFFLIKDFIPEFNKLFISYSKFNPNAPFPTVEDFIKFEDYKNWGIIRNFEIEIDDPQKSLNQFLQLLESQIIDKYIYPEHGKSNPRWVQDKKKVTPSIKIDLKYIKDKFSRGKYWIQEYKKLHKKS